MKQGAIFDMDGLMFDTEKVWQKCWDEVADEMHVTLEAGFRKEICGTSGRLMDSIIEKYYHVDNGNPIALDVRERVHQYLAEGAEEKPGLRKILQMFKDHGVKMAVASSSPREQIESNLQKAGVRDYIDAVVSGTELKKGKPAPDIFLKAAEELNIPAEDCYVFEDAINGVKAGHAAGAATIMIPDMIQPTDEVRELAAGIYETLADASDAIEEGLL